MRNGIAGIVAAVFLVTVATAAHGQDSFGFDFPDPNAQIPLNTDQSVKVRWMRGARPVVGGKVKLATTLGVVQIEERTTGNNGVATFVITSTTVGKATLTATTSDTSPVSTATLSVEFSASIVADQPYGEFATRTSATGQLQLWMFNERIGFRGSNGVAIEDVALIAQREGLTQLTPLSDNVFVLKVEHLPGNVNASQYLRTLTRRLQSDWPEIEKAGRVAKVFGSDQWLVVPDEVLAKFREGQDASITNDLIYKFGPDEVEPAPLDPDRYLIRLPVSSDPSNQDLADEDALDVAAQLSANTTEVVYAEPNYMIPFDLRADPATDPNFNYQWHHENDGTYATEDADVDSTGAWTFGWGSQGVTIAVVDRGFDINHPDLIQNLQCEVGEWCENQGKRVEDVMDNDNTDLLSTSTYQPWFAHGTRAAGVAAERGGNGIGYTGACPLCKLMLIRTEQDLNLIANAYDEAIDRKVSVISNSWGIVIADTTGEPIKSIIERIDKAVAAGITVVFAMSNTSVDNCGANLDISSLPNVIGVSGITDYDLRSADAGEARGFGTCMDVLGPTRGGARGIRTTSVKMISGVATSTYWHNFGGTSSATPLVAGIIGLMLSQNPSLTPVRVQRILQDTADRVDPAHADYSWESGFSKPGGKATHGYGRVNAREAVRLVTPSNLAIDASFAPGLGSKDLLLRDHEFDWGNTERPSHVIFDSPRWDYTHHQSVDIKIDVEPFKLAIPANGIYSPKEFLDIVTEDPQIDKRARVYVRLRNRGPDTINVAKLKLHVATITNTFPDLPANFWAVFPNDSTMPSAWDPLPAKKLTAIK